jgi:cellulose synthase/poly-beta-1,6-N-acetylglucosamine synthase-like glycosyltransferase
MASGELVVVLDADSYPEKDYFNKVVGYFDDPLVGAATATCTPRNRVTFLEKLQVIEYKVIAFTRKLLEFVDSIYVVPGTAGVYRRTALDSIGGFDQNNITEDIEATWHLASKGWKIRMCLSASITTEVPNKIKPWYKQRRRWAVGGLQCIAKYRKFIFRHGMFGYFIVPFFTIGLLIGLIGMGFFGYLFLRRIISSYLLTKFSIETGVPVIAANEIYLGVGVVNFIGLTIFLFYLLFSLFVLSIMKDRMLEKQSFFNLLFYMLVYMLIYPLVTLTSISHYIRGRRVWR